MAQAAGKTTPTESQADPVESTAPDTTSDFEVHGHRLVIYRTTVQASGPDAAAQKFREMVESGKGDLTVLEDRVTEVVANPVTK